MISVVIPTLGVRPELLRAVESVRAQTSVPCIALVVVNGNRYDPAIVETLEANPFVHLLVTPRPGVANARLEGVRAVETPFFCLLDDDDELLPDSLVPVMDAFEAGADVVATNGLTDCAGTREVRHQHLLDFGDDHARALLQENWLNSGGIFCRTDAVPSALFENLPNYMELTQLAMRMATRCQVRRVDCRTFVYHLGAADQATRSPAYLRAEPVVMRQIMREVSRADIRSGLRRKRSAALHDCAEYEFSQGNLAQAWRDHLASMMGGGGHRYLSYTRHLLRETMASWLRGMRAEPLPEAAAQPVSHGPEA
ncbi:glycosyltransferase family 2 protein [Pedomonas mirosovicensis]|uniref:glycosyltransferase family 2 protein n=1 Tax=Pedomonas mirosovicensis TaxID=2908641 RepID=UPI0021691A90|nr:glycosyltransferase [Pedomonas mirosovicensis]MCH8685860.1 glycosyltransferase [Pedomonas mirosovicensis]